MRFRRALGWTLFVCGVLASLVFVLALAGTVLIYVDEHRHILRWLVGGGIALVVGWAVAHTGKPSGYNLPLDHVQAAVTYYQTILKCIGERMSVKESQGRTCDEFHYGKSEHGEGCLLCEASTPCRTIRKAIDKSATRSRRYATSALIAWSPLQPLVSLPVAGTS